MTETIQPAEIHYIANTEQMGQLLRDSTEHGYNRSFPPEDVEQFIANLSPEGTHMMAVLMLHEHINGELVDPHYRMNVYMARKDRTIEQSAKEPMFIDMTIALVEKLDTDKPRDEAHRGRAD